MTAENRNEPKIKRHWGTMLLGLTVAAVFLIAVFSYQVKSTEWAVVTTLGNISGIDSKGAYVDPGAGLFPRWPYPIQIIYKFDRRIRCFSGNVGSIEETLTADRKNVVVGIFVCYKIVDPVSFFKSVVDIPNAEEQLNSFMRTSKNSVIGRYNFDQLVNTDPKKMKLGAIEDEIKKQIAEDATKIGIYIDSVGIKSVLLPEGITKKVFKRMISERQVAASEYLSDGEKQATIIRAEADRRKRQILADAEAKAKTIKAEGDAKAATYYATFSKNPELASFLRKLDSLKKIMKTKTTLVLDTDSAPFDLFKMDPKRLGPLKNEKDKK
jgi:membrane protease subunit HflC